jgi:hypothetical protein
VRYERLNCQDATTARGLRRFFLCIPFEFESFEGFSSLKQLKNGAKMMMTWKNILANDCDTDGESTKISFA